MYYDNTSISVSQKNRTGVWDVNYQGVWHLSDNAANTNVVDSTGVNGLADAVNTSTKAAAGRVAGALNFNGTNDVLAAANSSNFKPPTDMTVSFWIYGNQTPVARGEDACVFYKAHSVAPWLSYQVCWSSADNTMSAYWNNSVPVQYNTYGATPLGATTWYYVTYGNSGSDGAIYINGTNDTWAASSSHNFSGTILNSDSPLYVGSINGAIKRLNGTMDETRLSSVARSGGWIATEYNDQSSPSTFLTFSGAVACGTCSAGQAVIQTITAGSLSVTAPVSATLTSQNPGTAVAAQALGAMIFTDTLNDGSAWSVTLAATDFGAAKIPFTNLTIGVTTAANYSAQAGDAGTPGAGTASQTLAGADVSTGDHVFHRHNAGYGCRGECRRGHVDHSKRGHRQHARRDRARHDRRRDVLLHSPVHNNGVSATPQPQRDGPILYMMVGLPAHNRAPLATHG